MRIDQARDEDVLREVDSFVIRKFFRRVCDGKNLLDGTVAQRDGVVLENRARRLDRYDPAGAKE
jgi:hypothetical protein